MVPQSFFPETPAAKPASEVTALTPPEEQAFRSWAQTNQITDVDQPESHYDYRGFWKASGGPSIRFGVDHFPDTFKQHGHPTFSVESQYSAGAHDGGHWNGDTYVPASPTPAPQPQAPAAVAPGFFPQAPTDRLTDGMKRAATTKPDTAARIFGLQLKTGLPHEVIERNLDDVERAAAANNFDPVAFRAKSPVLASWLEQHPLHSALVSDDLVPLTGLERTLGFARRLVGDPAISLLKGAISLPEAAVGLADIATLGRAGRAAERLGYQPELAKSILTTYYTKAQTKAFASVSEADGAVATAVAALSHPSVIAHSVLESIPLMLSSAVAGAALPMLNPAISGAVGEGVAQAGSAAEQSRAGSPTGTLTPKQAILATTSGTVTGAIGVFGGRLAQRLGIADVDTMLAGAAVSAPARRGLAKQVVLGAIEEGFFEELPQSIQEQVQQNAADGKPLMDGVDNAAVMGLLAGAVMGGGAQVVEPHSRQVFEQLGQDAAAAKTAQRSPEKLGEFISQATDGGIETVHAPLESWDTYWQSKGVDPAAKAAEVTGDPQAYPQAVLEGRDLAIPTDRYVTQLAGTEHNAFFKDELRLGLDEMNAREATAFADQQQADTTAGPTPPTDEERLHAEFVSRLMEGGQMSRSTAETTASVFASVFPNVGERAGLDVQALADKWLPEVQSGAEPVSPPPAISATFLAHGPDGPLYNVVGGPASGSTVSAARLEALGIAVPETPAFTGEPLSGAQIREQMLRTRTADRLDKPVPSVDSGTADVTGGPQESGGTRQAGLPARNRIAPSYPRERERPAQRIAREAQHIDGLFTQYLESAQTVDPTVDPAELRAEFEFRLDAWKGLHETYIDSGHDPRDLLRAIAENGGLFEVPGAGGWSGELRDLKSGTKFGSVAGVKGVFRGEVVKDMAGRPITGLPFDIMHQRLQQDPRFAWIENVNMLFDALDEIIRNPPNFEGLPGTDELRADVGIDERQAWWQNSWRPKPIEATTDAIDTGGDVSFNIDEFDQGPPPKVDILPTGEQQPRLPGAEQVREQNIQTPQFEAPFSLTAPVDTSKKGQQDTLFQESGKRGSITFRPGQSPLLRFFENRDLSTAFHELGGHLFLELMGDVTDQIGALDPASLTDQQKKLQSDYGEVLQWLGVENRGQIGKEQHEQFARGFEAYLFDGKAPSLSLARTFARVRAWLLGIYRSAANLNVTLTPEVRAVFDRLLVSDQAIEEADAARRVPPMFLTPTLAGMSEKEFDLYRQTVEDASRTAREALDRKLLAEVRREQTETWKAQREGIEQHVTSEVQQRPVYRALALLQKGTHPNGEPIPGIDGPVKLSKDIIVDRYGKERLKTLPRPYVYTTKDGIDPDHAAELVGFTSGDALLRALAAAPKIDAVIQQETDQRMLDQHGSLLLDGTREEAQIALTNEDRDKVIRKELKALHELERTVSPFRKLQAAITAGAKQEEIDALAAKVKELNATRRSGAVTIRAGIPTDQVIRQTAEARIAALPVRRINAQNFWWASNKNNRDAVERAARQDYPGAVEAHTQNLLNRALYRMAEQVKDEIDTGKHYAQRLDSAASRRRIGLAGGTFQDQIDGLLDRFEFATVSKKALDRRAKLSEWAAGMEAQGLPVDLPDGLLDDARRTNYQNLSVEEFRGVIDTLKHIDHLAGLKNRLLANVEQREFAAVRDGITASIDEHHDKRPVVLEFRPAEKKWRTIGDYFASHTKLATIVQGLDGYLDGGPFWSAFMRPINEAANAKETRNHEVGTAYWNLIEQHYPGRELWKLNELHEIPALNRSVSKEFVIAVAQNWGNAQGRERLLNDPLRKFDEGQIQAMLDTLDQNDWNFVQGHWDYLNTFWPEIAAKMKRLTGIEPVKVDALPIQTRYGEMRGGYHPLAYDSRLSARAGQFAAAQQGKLTTAAAYLKTTTKRGHEKTRLEHVNLPVRLELGVAFQHLDQVVHDLTHHEMLIDVTRLLRDSSIAKAIYETKGDQVYEQLKNGLEDIARGSLAQPGKPTVMDTAATWMRQRTQLAMLGLNLWTAAQQPLGVFNGMNRVGVKWVAKGMGRWLKDAASMENTAGWIASVSPMMRERVTTATQDLHDLRGELAQPGGWFDKLVRTVSQDTVTKQTLTDGFLFHIGLMQRVADIPTWLGQYEKSMAGGEPEDRAIAIADQAVLDSQGGGQIKDLAKVQRGGPIARLFMTFASYGVTVFNAAKRNVEMTEFKSPASILQLLGNMSLLYVMPAVATIALKHAAGRGAGPDDDPETWLREIGGELLSTSLSGLALFREATAAVQTALHLDQGARGYSGPAGLRPIQGLYDFAQQVAQGESDTGLWHAVNGIAGTVFAYPSAQVQKTVDGALALYEGRTSNPAALLFGPPPKQAAR